MRAVRGAARGGTTTALNCAAGHRSSAAILVSRTTELETVLVQMCHAPIYSRTAAAVWEGVTRCVIMRSVRRGRQRIGDLIEHVIKPPIV